MTTLAVAVALSWLLLAAGAWLVDRLLRQNGRLFVRIEALEREIDEIRDGGAARVRPFGSRSLSASRINRKGLRAGTPAPAFTLPRVDGGELSLDDYAGRRVLLVFSDPECGPCNTLAPELEKLSRQAGGPAVIMISRGSADANRKKVREHGLTFPVVLQRQWEISRAYGMFATPMAYLVDDRGVIAADVAVGVDSIVNVLSQQAAAGDREPTSSAAASTWVPGSSRVN